MASYAGPVAKSGAVRRSVGPLRRMVNSEMFSCSLASSHHGEAGAARPSSAEVLFRVTGAQHCPYVWGVGYDPNKSICVGSESLIVRRQSAGAGFVA
jgi:hypothetical protein